MKKLLCFFFVLAFLAQFFRHKMYDVYVDFILCTKHVHTSTSPTELFSSMHFWLLVTGDAPKNATKVSLMINKMIS